MAGVVFSIESAKLCVPLVCVVQSVKFTTGKCGFAAKVEEFGVKGAEGFLFVGEFGGVTIVGSRMEGGFIMTYDNAPEVLELAAKYNFQT